MLNRYLVFLVSVLNTQRLVTLTFILLLPALFVGYFGDDYLHYISLNQLLTLPPANDGSLFGLFSFVNDDPARNQILKNYSIVPWWGTEDAVWKFWRPLTEITHYIDYVWIKQVEVMHLNSILIFVAIVLLLKPSYGIVSQDKILISLAAIIFAISNIHAYTIAWLCNRSALLALFFGLLTLIFHHKTLNDKRFYFASISTVVLAFLSGEMGASTGAILFAYAIFLDPNGFKKGICRILPYFGVFLVWAYFYKHFGMGVFNSTLYYINPTDTPLTYLQHLMQRAPQIFFSAFTPIPSDILARLVNPLRSWAVALGYVFTFMIVVFTLFGVYRRQAAFFITVLFIVTLPAAASFPADRNLVFVSFASSGLVAIMILQLKSIVFSESENSEVKAQLKTFSALLIFNILILCHLIISPLTLPVISYFPKIVNSSNVKLTESFNQAIGTSKKQVISFGGVPTSLIFLAPISLTEGHSLPSSILNLTLKQDEFSIHEIDSHTLGLSSEKGFFSQSDKGIHTMMADMQVGQVFQLPEASIKIMSMNKAGFPTRLEVKTKSNVRDINYLVSHKGKFQAIDFKELSSL